MRILAPCKRDSVTGEEVVLLTVTNEVVTTARQSDNSVTIISNNNNNNNNVARQGTTDSPSQVDVLLPKKLVNKVDRESRHVYGAYSTINYGVNKTSLNKVSLSQKKTKREIWGSQLRKRATSFWRRTFAACCSAVQVSSTATIADTSAPSSTLLHERKPKNQIVKCASSTKVVGKAKKIISKERTKGEEASLSKVQRNSSADTLISDCRKTECISNAGCATVEESTHVETTTGTASNVKPIAAAETANFGIMRTGIYHEKQVKSLCALHALNNLLQDGKAFKQEDLDKICSDLDPNSWVNPHKSVFGLGNYDINVIMTALQQKKLEAVWFDKRKDPSEELNFGNIYGFILNIPSDCRLGWLALPIKRKHWVAIRNLPSITERDAGRSNYYNLDSKFDKPESIGSIDNLIEYLRGELKSPEKELFIVVTEDIGRLETWRRHPPPAPSCSNNVGGMASGSNTHLLPVPTGESGPDAAAGSGNNRRTSNDSGVVDLLPDLRDINVVDLNKEDLMRRQSSGVWSDLT